MATIVTILLWVLGIVNLGAGAMKAFMPADRLTAQPNMAWIERTGITRARIAGLAEVAAGVTFLLTALDVGFFGDNVWLAGIAAVGFVVIMALAAVTVHQPADEPTVPNVVLGVLGAVLAILLFIG